MPDAVLLLMMLTRCAGAAAEPNVETVPASSRVAPAAIVAVTPVPRVGEPLVRPNLIEPPLIASELLLPNVGAPVTRSVPTPAFVSVADAGRVTVPAIVSGDERSLAICHVWLPPSVTAVLIVCAAEPACTDRPSAPIVRVFPLIVTGFIALEVKVSPLIEKSAPSVVFKFA